MNILDRIRSHTFHPIKDGFTYDRYLDEQGVADPNDNDWLVRTLAVRDLVRIGSDATALLLHALNDDNPHVRQVVAMVLGILRVGKAALHLEKIFADWCPVCHREFQELIETRREFEEKDIRVFTLECHDLFPVRVMAGKELEPDYWFAEEPFLKAYTEKIWWPHLADRAAGAGTRYGVQPMAYTVHAEWINRPAVVIIDQEGIVRFAYHGTFWGDRPSIHDILEIIETENYDFISPKRLKKG